MDDIKRGILCQLFGGTIQSDLQQQGGVCDSMEDEHGHVDNDDFFLSEEGREGGGGRRGHAGTGDGPGSADKDKDKSHHRSDVNILLIGDPGTSKSQLLSYVHKVGERGTVL